MTTYKITKSVTKYEVTTEQVPPQQVAPQLLTDRGLCKFFILDKCRRGDGCQWVHTKNQCEKCGTYTERSLCYKCNKKMRQEKKDAYEQRLKRDGVRCSNETCHGYTLSGDYCNSCFDDAKQYILGPCRNKKCNRRVLGGKGFCSDACQKGK